MKRVFVWDSYFTDRIIANLRELYQDKAEIFDGRRYENTEEKIDLFFLSANEILNGNVVIPLLKKKFGSKECKVVVMSVSRIYLSDVQKNHQADHFLLKNKVVKDPMVDPDLPEIEKETLLSYLE